MANTWFKELFINEVKAILNRNNYTLSEEDIDEIVDRVSELMPGDGSDGKNGLSAYEIWLNAGNTGSELDFLLSLKGSNGVSITNITIAEV